MAIRKALPQVVEPRTRTFEVKFQQIVLASQTFQARVSLQGSITRLDLPGGQVKKVLFVNFNGSFAGPGKLMFNKDDNRGFFIDRLVVRAWLQSTPDGLHDDRLVPGYKLAVDKPETTNEGGEVSSSITFGMNESTGFSGTDPSGSVGADLSISSSHSHSLQDFSFANESTGQIVQHRIFMQMLGDGTRYQGPRSLVDPFQNPLVGARLKELPTLAQSNVPIPTQAIWINDTTSHLVERAQLSVEVKAHFEMVEATNNFFTIESRSNGLDEVFGFGFPIDFTVVDGKSVAAARRTEAA